MINNFGPRSFSTEISNLKKIESRNISEFTINPELLTKNEYKNILKNLFIKFEKEYKKSECLFQELLILQFELSFRLKKEKNTKKFLLRQNLVFLINEFFKSDDLPYDSIYLNNLQNIIMDNFEAKKENFIIFKTLYFFYYFLNINN